MQHKLAASLSHGGFICQNTMGCRPGSPRPTGSRVSQQHPFVVGDSQRANIDGKMGVQIAWMLGFDLTVGLFLVLGLLQSDNLAFCEDFSPLAPLWPPGPSGGA